MLLHQTKLYTRITLQMAHIKKKTNEKMYNVKQRMDDMEMDNNNIG